MTTFAPETRYTCWSPANMSITWTFQVIGRSAKMVRLELVRNGELTGETKRCKVRLDRDGHEFVLPLGRYSFCPVLRSDRLA